MPYRSWLFVPGDSARKIARAAGSGADALILDLEDAVAPEGKSAARALVAAALHEPAPMPRFVRVNALGTGLAEADVAALAPAGPAGWVLPKCEGAGDVAALVRLIDRAGGDPGAPVLALATETARGVLNLMRADWAHPRLAGLTWGAEDLAADLGAGSNRDATGAYAGPFRLARDLTLLAARAAGVAAVDAVFTDLTDPEGLAAEARAAAALGFDGKLAIHPAQVAVIHAAFAPDAAALDWARRVIAALDAAGTGVARLDGRMLDRPHRLQAERILARADRPPA